MVHKMQDLWNDLNLVPNPLSDPVQCQRNNYYTTPLHMASENNHDKIVTLLLRHGTPIDSEDFKGRTPLFKATEAGHLKVVKILVRNGADVKVKDAYGKTLEQVAKEGGHVNVYLFLTKYKAAKCSLNGCLVFWKKGPRVCFYNSICKILDEHLDFWYFHLHLKIEELQKILKLFNNTVYKTI